MKSSTENDMQELEKLSSLTNLDLPTIGKYIWTMMGITFVVISSYLYFGEPEVIDGVSASQVATLFLVFGAGILVNELIIEPLKQKIRVD
jgi:hypothetical protein